MKKHFTTDELISFKHFWITAVDTDINNWSTAIFAPYMFEVYSDRLLFLDLDDENNFLKDIDNWGVYNK